MQRGPAAVPVSPGKPPANTGGCRVLSHTADVGLEAWGPDLASVYVQIALGMFALMADRRTVRPSLRRRIRVTAGDREALLVGWLTELLYYVDAERLLFRDVSVESLDDSTLIAVARGEPADPARHRLKAVVKAATYHRLKVEPPSASHTGWRARVYLDV